MARLRFEVKKNILNPMRWLWLLLMFSGSSCVLYESPDLIKLREQGWHVWDPMVNSVNCCECENTESLPNSYDLQICRGLLDD